MAASAMESVACINTPPRPINAVCRYQLIPQLYVIYPSVYSLHWYPGWPFRMALKSQMVGHLPLRL